MNNRLLSTLCIGCVMSVTALASTTIDVTPKMNNAAPTFTVSKGCNLGHRSSVAGRRSPVADRCMKRLEGQQPFVGHRSSVIGRRSPVVSRRSVASLDETTALLFESFESCEHFSDVMPEGWMSMSAGDAVLPPADHWIAFSRGYTQFYQFTPPADGNMMAAVFYNDDTYKDEWLVSPEVTIPDGGYELSFYWYTVPYYLYVIDRFHVNFEDGVFIDREVLFDIEVLAKTSDQEEWTVIYDLERQFADLEYSELASLDYDKMQRAVVSLADYAGKDIQIAFRYWGEGGNTFCLDAVRVDLPMPDVSFMPDYSRLFYGYSPDLWWMGASIEFYPVEYPVSWYNTSDNPKGSVYNWLYTDYFNGDDFEWKVSDNTDRLDVTYHPDYSSTATLVNNFYHLPKLKAQMPSGAVSDYASATADFLQAGGTTEYTAADEDGNSLYTKYTALPFDILKEGFGIHVEEDEELGFQFVPIFGYDVNSDAWWEHYCFPNGMRDDQYAYADGFVNMYLPHPSAPLVIKGVSAAAFGKISPDVDFTMNIYTTDEDGIVNEKPMVSRTISGADVKVLSGFATKDYLVLDFSLDAPVIFDTEHTGYAYLVEITGYHDERIEYFAPIQSTEPNPYEWCLGFYHIKHSGHNDITNEMSYVAFFKDEYGRDLYTSFAIGLDAHYPWLMLADPDNPYSVDDQGRVCFKLHGYYDGSDYKVELPAGLTCTLSGRYTTEAALTVPYDYPHKTVPVTITAPGVKLSLEVPVDMTSVESVGADKGAGRADVYNAQGQLIMRGAAADDLSRLPAGLYIHGSRKVLIKH